MVKKSVASREFLELVRGQEKKGNVVVMTIEGPMAMDLNEIIRQPADGLLYDLNRDPATVATFIGDSKWVNDYAVGLVIAKLKDELDHPWRNLWRHTRTAARRLWWRTFKMRH